MRSADVEKTGDHPPAGRPEPGHPIIEITPSIGQYRQICRDLAKLRKAGAPSNTAAIVDAIHHAAQGDKVDGDKETPGSATTPPARQQEVES